MRALRLLPVVLSLLALPAGAARAGDPAAPAPAPVRGFAGFHVEPVAVLTAAQRAALGVHVERGSVVAFVLPAGPAALAGLQVGDLLQTWDGKPVPEVEKPDRYEPGHHAWRVKMREAMDALVAGRVLVLEVRRGDATATVRITPAGEADIHRMMGGTTEPYPDPAGAGAPSAFADDFDDVAPGAALPEGFHPYEGRWQVVPEPGASKPNAVLRQDHPVLPWAVLLVTGPGRACADGRVRVRFMPVSGVVDASAGIVFRARDAKNYYVVRANALEDNFNVYVVKDGVRTALKESRVALPAMGAWHVIELEMAGDAFKATLDGKDTVEAKDSTYASGWCGLWTKADSVTVFDDLTVAPAPK